MSPEFTQIEPSPILVVPELQEDLRSHHEIADFLHAQKGDGQFEGGRRLAESVIGGIDEFENLGKKAGIELDLFCQVIARCIAICFTRSLSD